MLRVSVEVDAFDVIIFIVVAIAIWCAIKILD